MSEKTGIAWCDSTFNPWIGCTKVSPGCDHCYAERDFDLRRHRVTWGTGQERSRTAPSTWKHPKEWNDAHAEFFAQHGRRRRVFCASLADVFDNEVPTDWRRDLFDLIERTPHLDWLLLTKRIGNARAMLDECYFGRWAERVRANVWLGATVVDQAEYDRDIGKLLRTPAAVHFLSLEPLLGGIDMRLGGAAMPDYAEHRPLARLDWVIVGGESGPSARPMHPDWARSLRDQCAAAGVPSLFKQWGEWLPGSQAREVGDQIARVVACNRGWKWDDGTRTWRIGTKAAGRALDGVTHDAWPQSVGSI